MIITKISSTPLIRQQAHLLYSTTQNGNAISDTNDISLAYNSVLNGGFELWTSGTPNYWAKFSTGGTLQQSTNVKNGYYSWALTSTNNEIVQVRSDSFAINENTSYNIAWHVDTISTTASGAGRAAAGNGRSRDGSGRIINKR